MENELIAAVREGIEALRRGRRVRVRRVRISTTPKPAPETAGGENTGA